MVSFQTPFPELTQTNPTHLQSADTTTNSNKKRKWDHDSQPPPKDILPFKQWTTRHKAAPIPLTTTKYFSDIELHLETPLPSEWQRCLNIQSGEIHFYNTRTQKRTARDPREESSEEPTSPRDCHMSLDLELNLPCGSRNHNNYSSSEETKHVTTTTKKKSRTSPSTTTTTTTTTSPPTTPTHHLFKSSLNNTIIEKNFFENLKVEDDEESAAAAAATEMMAAACMRCHMLVMLQKSSPTCPNCKFVHPPYHTPPDLFNPTLSLSC